MNKEKITAMDYAKSIKWTFRFAYKINRKMLILWVLLSVTLSIIPAVSLLYQKTILSNITAFTIGEEKQYRTIIFPVVFYGVLLVVMGISARINADLISSVMYDAYYLGQQNELIEYAEKVDVEKLMEKQIRDDYINTILSDSSLVIFISSFCVLLGKIVGSATLLFVAWNNSRIIFVFALSYTMIALLLNIAFIGKTKQNDRYIRALRTRANYYENLCKDLGAAKEIRLYGTTGKIIKQWEMAFDPTEKYDRTRAFNIEIQSMVSGIIFYVFVFAILIYSIISVSKGRMETASLLVLFTLCINLFNTISGIIKTFLTMYDSMYFLNLQRKLLASESILTKANNINMEEKEGQNAIEVRNLSYVYPDGTQALSDVSFSLKKGEIIALLGSNGSGKTTLVKIIAGILKPNSGKVILIGGSKNIGVFFQDSFLFHKSLRENIAFGNVELHANDDNIEEALIGAGGKNIIKKLSKGLDTILGKRVYANGVELSGGEKQCVGVARALFSNKNIILLDEPSSALDPVAEVEQFKSIKKALNGKSAILVSHRVGFARLADRIIVLGDGRILESGTHEELLQHNGAYSSLYKAQAQYYF